MKPDLQPGDVIRILSGYGEGQLRYFRKWERFKPHGEEEMADYACHSPADTSGPYSSTNARLGDFEVVPAPSAKNGYDLIHHILPRVFGWKRWEKVEEMDGALVANMLPGGGWMNGFLSGSWHGPDGRYDSWAKYALVSGQSTSYTGEAYVLVYGRDRYSPPKFGRALADAVKAHIDGKDAHAPGDLAAALQAYEAGQKYGYPRGFKVSVCDHEKIVHGDARPSHGWHPGHCGKCGMNMTVDSSD